LRLETVGIQSQMNRSFIGYTHGPAGPCEQIIEAYTVFKGKNHIRPGDDDTLYHPAGRHNLQFAQLQEAHDLIV